MLQRCNDGDSIATCRAWRTSRAEFLSFMHRTQTPDITACDDGKPACFRDGPPCKCRRVLEVIIGSLDGFAVESQTLGRALRMALATERMMIVHPGWCSNYASAAMRNNRADVRPWGCLWNHTNACPYRDGRLNHHKQYRCANGWHAQHRYSGLSAPHSQFFNTRFYGPSLIQRLFLGDFEQGRFFINSYNHGLAKQMGDGSAGRGSDPIPSHDAVPDWERRMGGFWVRSQIQDFLWRPTAQLERAVSEHPAMLEVKRLRSQGLPYIGCDRVVPS